MAATPDQEPVFSAEDAARIHAALDELPAEQREVLVLRFLEELSYEEIGGIVGCPLGTVRSRLARARAQLLSALNDPLLVTSALDAGADDYLTRPVPSRVLLAHIRNLTRRHQVETNRSSMLRQVNSANQANIHPDSR